MVTHMIPEEAGTRSTIIACNFEICSEGTVQDVYLFRLNGGDADGIMAFSVHGRVALLHQDQALVLDLDIV